MISPRSFIRLLEEHDIDFFTGVPDSLLKEFATVVTGDIPASRHVIAANEGNAVALAAGYHLATGRSGLVYLQNSGLGNAVNPLTSLVDPLVYGIPMMLLVGWRGEPGVKDEPQHVKQGMITLRLLETLDIPYAMMPDTEEGLEACLTSLMTEMQKGRAVALVVRKGTFAPGENSSPETSGPYPLLREQALAVILGELGDRDVVVSTTGMASREVFEYREQNGQSHEKDFLTVGSMGHASQIALGIALTRPDRTVLCIDGDGALLMHMGALAIIGSRKPGNLRHIVINNGAHESVGGQPTAAFSIDVPTMATAAGYAFAERAQTEEEIRNGIAAMCSVSGPALLEIRVQCGHRKDLGRPTTTPQENKEGFMGFLHG